MSEEIIWRDIRELTIEGRGWDDTESFYDRLPARAKGIVRDPVWNLGQHSAGICARFVISNSPIHARWSLRGESLAMNHMPATGVSGLDLYARDDGGAWAWLGVGRPESFPTNQGQLAGGLPEGRRECLLYLPLYNGVTAVEVGFSPGALVEPGPPRPAERGKPVVYYGTSIAQGGCASRPGMAHTAILGRWLDRPVINLGFSGNGLLFFYDRDGCGTYWVHADEWRLTRLDDPVHLSRTVAEMRKRQWLTHRFFREHIPGFARAHLVDVHPHIARALLRSQEPGGFTEHDIPWEHVEDGENLYEDSVARVMGHPDTGQAINTVTGPTVKSG